MIYKDVDKLGVVDFDQQRGILTGENYAYRIPHVDGSWLPSQGQITDEIQPTQSIPLSFRVMLSELSLLAVTNDNLTNARELSVHLANNGIEVEQLLWWDISANVWQDSKA